MSDEPKIPTIEELQAQLADRDAQIASLTTDHQKAMAAQSKASSEVAELKKKLASYMSDEEKARAEREAEMETLRAENAQYRRDAQVRTYEDFYRDKLSFSTEHAKQMAEAMASDDKDAQMAVQQAHNAELLQKLQEEALRGTPKPPAGIPPKGDPDEMSDAEYYAALKAGKL